MDSKFSLLETTLTMLNGAKYIPNFKKFDVDTNTLSLLTDEDLQTIGVDDEELRSRFIKQCSNLPSLLDSRIDLTVNDKYLMSALHEVDHHLLMLNASLNYALQRKNVQLCDIKLQNVSKCLISCQQSMQKELLSIHRLFAPKKNTRKSKWKILLLSIISATASCFILKNYLTTR